MALPSLKAFAFLSKAPAAPRHETANSLKPTNHMRPDRRRRLLSCRPLVGGSLLRFPTDATFPLGPTEVVHWLGANKPRTSWTRATIAFDDSSLRWLEINT